MAPATLKGDASASTTLRDLFDCTVAFESPMGFSATCLSGVLASGCYNIRGRGWLHVSQIADPVRSGASSSFRHSLLGGLKQGGCHFPLLGRVGCSHGICA
jgi:hypothetical protein